MKPPLVSVVIPCFNAAPMLEAALRSVIEQSYPNIEIIFVDNNSTDNSVELATAIAAVSPRPFQIAHCPEQGCNHPRNLGYALAKGDYIQWLDADDTLAPDKIARQVEMLEREPGIAVAYCDWISTRHMRRGGT